MFPEKLKQYNILLASKSPRRKQLMEDAGYFFDVIHSIEVNEDIPINKSNEDAAVYLSEIKAEAYRHLIDQSTLLITADTVVCLSNKILGKPTDYKEAFRMLSALSGKMHTVITGVTVMTLNKKVSFSSSTKVWFKPMTEEEISHYINTCKPYDKAGAYGIQDRIGLNCIEKIEGSYFNVMGLPTEQLYGVLKAFLQ
jgi:septum formation protein